MVFFGSDSAVSWVVRCEEIVRRSIRTALPSGIYRMGARALDAIAGARRLGWRQYRTIVAARHSKNGHQTVEWLNLPGIDGPFAIRHGTTDGHTVLQTLGRESFARFAPPGAVRLIIDAGANIGDTVVWFLARYPEAFVIAIEPDPDNANLLRQNTAAYRDRVNIIEGALWTSAEPLQIVRTAREDGFYVAAATDSEAITCRGVTMREILAIAGERPIDIFKCDIEGAEEPLFAGDCEWTNATRMIYVESHTPKATAAIEQAAEQHGFPLARYREWLVLGPRVARRRESERDA